MDNKHEILELLRGVAAGRTTPEQALLELKTEPFRDLGYAKVDFCRPLAQGAVEVIYGAGKTAEQIAGIAAAMGERGCRNILITRMDAAAAEIVAGAVPLDYHPVPRLGIAFPGSGPPWATSWWPPAAPVISRRRRRPPSPPRPWATGSPGSTTWGWRGSTGC